MSLLHLEGGLSGRRRGLLRVAVGLLALTVAAMTIHTLLGVGGRELDNAMHEWAPSLGYVLAAGIVILRAVSVRDERGPWTTLAVGLTLYGAGNLLWSLWFEHQVNPPVPSVCDVLWLALYPASYLGVAWLSRTRRGRLPAGVWLDGIVAGLGIAALSAALVFHPVLEAATGSTAAVATNLAYPIGDLLLAGLVMGVLGLRGWRVDRRWAMLGGGFLVLCVADSIYLRQVADGSVDSSNLANIFYLLGVMLLALSAWQPKRNDPAPNLDGWSILLVPMAFVAVAVGIIAFDHYHEDIDALAFTLALATLVMALVRTGLTFRDVRALAETRRQALTDDLTSLGNRRHLLKQLHSSITAARITGEQVALMIVDLDHFKELNDTLGHHAGDLLLSQIGPRLQSVLRSGDTVARLGGDEFGVVVMPAGASAALDVADKLRGAISEPFDIDGLRLHVGASLGIALFPDHGDDAEALLQRADVAMYEAKASRSGRELYVRERDKHTRERLELSGDLGHAIEQGALDVYFQPKAVAASKRIAGVEALVRWNHPERGMIPPTEFVPLAEQAGLARKLTTFVLGRALDQCRQWRDAGHELHVAVNLTVPDLLDVAFPAEVTAALESRGLPPDALVLEVTETSVLADPTRIGNVLAQIGEAGIHLSLDDFGTGYSSLTHLKALPVGEVKIDRSFVMRMGDEPADAAIVGSTIHLAHSLGMRVVAEGVEDMDTWQRLAGLDCELIQGYALTRPLPADEIAPLLGDPVSEPVPASPESAGA